MKVLMLKTKTNNEGTDPNIKRESTDHKKQRNEGTDSKTKKMKVRILKSKGPDNKQ